MTNPLATVHYGKPLTDRELQILAAAANGHDNAQIAQDLFLAVHTVKTHLQRIYRKLAARDRAHAVALAFATQQLALAAVQPGRRPAPGCGCQTYVHPGHYPSGPAPRERPC